MIIEIKRLFKNVSLYFEYFLLNKILVCVMVGFIVDGIEDIYFLLLFLFVEKVNNLIVC